MRLMPRSWPVIALTLVGSVGLGVLLWRPAAGAPHTIKAANWSGGAVFTGGGKQFDRCSATSTNAKGMAITYAMDSQLRWSLAISNPDWTFTNDFSLSIDLNIDGRPFRGRALVRENKSLLIQVNDQIALFAALRIAAQLRATAGGLAIEFDLANSSEALSAVAQCALKQASAGTSGTKTNPKGKAARVEPIQDPAAQKEVLGFAHTMKAYGNIGSFRVLPAGDGLPGSLAAVGWSAEIGCRGSDDFAGERSAKKQRRLSSSDRARAAQMPRRVLLCGRQGRHGTSGSRARLRRLQDARIDSDSVLYGCSTHQGRRVRRHQCRRTRVRAHLAAAN